MVAHKFGGDFDSSLFDLVLASLTVFLLPFLALSVFDSFGALFSLLIYYGFFCLVIVKWRKGTLDYRIPKNPLNWVFVSLLVVESVRLIIAPQVYEPIGDVAFIGFFFTLTIWAPINAFLEQLSWFYVYDSWNNFFKKGKMKYLFQLIGFLMYIALIGLIHVFFWDKFLFNTNKVYPLSGIYFTGQIILAIGYIPLYRRTRSVLPVAIIHLIVDLSAVLFTRYSIIPYLIK